MIDNYQGRLTLHRVWSFIEYDKIEILGAACSMFVAPSKICYIFDKVYAAGDLYSIELSLVNEKYYNFRIAFGTRQQADEAILQLKDLIRNLEIYRRFYFAPATPEPVEETAPTETPPSFWRRLKSIFSQ